MKLSDRVKPGEETKVGGPRIHPKGQFVFAFQEGTEFRVTDKHGFGPAFTYGFKLKSVDTWGDTDADVGGDIQQWCNLSFHNADGEQINPGGVKMFSNLMVHSGVATGDEDIEDFVTDQAVANIKLKVVDKLVGLRIGHRPKDTQVQADDGSWRKPTEEEYAALKAEGRHKTTEAYIMEIFPVSGVSSSGTSAAAPQPADTDY